MAPDSELELPGADDSTIPGIYRRSLPGRATAAAGPHLLAQP